MLSHTCGTPHRSNILPLCSAALRTTPVLSRSVSRRFASLKFSHPAPQRFATLQLFSTRSNIFRHRYTALCVAPILSNSAPMAPRAVISHSAPRRSAPLQLLRAALIFYHAASWPQISLRPHRERKIPPGVSYTVHPVNFTPEVERISFVTMLPVKLQPPFGI